MGYIDKYETILASAPALIAQAKEKGRMPAFGFTSNLDIVLHWDVKTYQTILDDFLQAEPSFEVGEEIRSMEDFARISAYFLKNGLGGNFDITESTVCDYLRERFSTELALGGTAAQGCAALGAMGFSVNVHITDACREVCDLMDYEGTETVTEKGVVPLPDAASGEMPVAHFILQFPKGDIIRIGEEEIAIPSSNRMILFYDRMQKEVPFDEAFFTYWESGTAHPASLLFSGFDAVIDEKVAAKKIDRMEVFLHRIREHTPGVKAYLEGAFYMNPNVKEMLFARLGPQVNIVGMNEEELAAQLALLGKEAALDYMNGILEALEELFAVFSFRGVILHSKDYALYYGEKMEDCDIEAGLTMGNLMAATRARIGRYGTQKEAKESLKIPLSKTGLRLYEEAETIRADRECVLVPARALEHPKYTIGLGDTFVAGVHTCFI